MSDIISVLWCDLWCKHVPVHIENLQSRSPYCFSKSELNMAKNRYKMLLLAYNSRYPRYAIWPRGGACHANHACAVLTVSWSCRLAFVFFHWKFTQVLQKSLSLSIKQACFKIYHHDLLRHLVAFSKFEWFISSNHKFKNLSTHFVHKP